MIKILGVGFPKSFWNDFSYLVAQRLGDFQLPLQFSWQKNKWTGFQATALNRILAEEPDLLVTSCRFFGGLGGLSRFMSMLTRESSKPLPRLLLLEDDLPLFFSELQQERPKAVLEYKALGALHLQKLEHLLLSAYDPFPLLEVEPTPHLRYRFSPPVFDPDQPCFVHREEISQVHWQDKDFEVDEFMELVTYLKTENEPPPDVQGLFLYQDKVYLKKAFNLDEILEIRLGNLVIEQVLPWNRAMGDRHLEERLVQGLAGLGQRLLLARQVEEARKNPQLAVSFGGLSLFSENPLTGRLAMAALERMGFENLDLAEQPRAARGRLLVNLSNRPIPAGRLLEVNLEDSLMEIKGFASLGASYLTKELPPGEEWNEEEIDARGKSLMHQAHLIHQRLEAQKGGKPMRQQERDLLDLAQDKLDLVQNLLAKGDVWDQAQAQSWLGQDSEVMVFYEDDEQAREIYQSLAGRGRCLYFDLAFLESFKVLMAKNLEPFRPFVEQGRVVLTANAAEQLPQILGDLQKKLDKKRAQMPLEEGENLLDQLDQISEDLEALSWALAWTHTVAVLGRHEEGLREGARECGAESLAAQLRKERIGKIMLVCEDERRSRMWADWSLGLFSPFEVEIEADWLALELADSLPAWDKASIEKNLSENPQLQEQLLGQLAKENANRVRAYLRDLDSLLKDRPADLLIYQAPVELALLAIQRLREYSNYSRDIPLLLVLDQLPQPTQVQALVGLNAFPLYLEPAKQENRWFFAQSLERLLL